MDDTTEDSRKHLKPIIINRKRYTNADVSLYRVYTAPGEFKLVEADSAHEAYTKSGLSRVHKIERENFFRYLTVKKEQIEPREGTVSFNTELPDRDRGALLIDEFVRTHEGDFGTKGDFTGMNIADLATEDKPKHRSVLKAPVPDFVPAADITDVVATVRPAEPVAEAAPVIEVDNTPMSAEDLDKLFGKDDLSTNDVNALFSKDSMSGDEVDKLFAKEHMSASEVDVMFEGKDNLSPTDVDALFGNKQSISASDVDSLFAKKSTMSTDQVDALFAPDIDPAEETSADALPVAGEFAIADDEVLTTEATEDQEPEPELTDEDVMSLLAPPPGSGA